jgi:hypothetical protein
LQTIRKRGEQNVRARGIMAGLPINIPIPAEGVIASYDWSELALNVAYKDLFCGHVKSGTNTSEYILTTSDKIRSSTKDVNAVNAVIDLNFNFLASKMFQVRGAAFTSAQLGFMKAASGSQTLASELKITFYKVVGAVETQIGESYETLSVLVGGSSAWAYRTTTVKTTITPTVIGNGETLRMRVRLPSLGAGYYTRLWFNPANEDIITGIITTQLVLNLPMRIDL